MGSLGSMATPRRLSGVESALPGRSLEVLTELRPGAHAAASTHVSGDTGPTASKTACYIGQTPCSFHVLEIFSGIREGISK